MTTKITPHTAGPLHYQEESDAYTHILRDQKGGYVASTVQSSLPHHEVDARRLAAAWNACQGVPTEALERCEPGTAADGYFRICSACYVVSWPADACGNCGGKFIEPDEISEPDIATVTRRLHALQEAARKAIDECCDLIGTPAGLALNKAMGIPEPE